MVDPVQVKNWPDYIRASAKTAAVLQKQPQKAQRQWLPAVAGSAFALL